MCVWPTTPAPSDWPLVSWATAVPDKADDCIFKFTSVAPVLHRNESPCETETGLGKKFRMYGTIAVHPGRAFSGAGQGHMGGHQVHAQGHAAHG